MIYAILISNETSTERKTKRDRWRPVETEGDRERQRETREMWIQTKREGVVEQQEETGIDRENTLCVVFLVLLKFLRKCWCTCDSVWWQLNIMVDDPYIIPSSCNNLLQWWYTIYPEVTLPFDAHLLGQLIQIVFTTIPFEVITFVHSLILRWCPSVFILTQREWRIPEICFI